MSTQPEATKRRKPRSPSYPGIALDTAIERARTLYQHEHHHSAPINSILSHWGYNPKSSGGLIAIAALKKYGLIEDEGSGEGRLAKLSERALAIVEDNLPDSPERDEAIRAAALAPKINAEVWKKFSGDLPSDLTIQHFLVREKRFTQEAALHYIRLFRRTISFAKLDDSVNLSDNNEDIERESVDAVARRGTVTAAAQVPQVTPTAITGQAIQLPLGASGRITIEGGPFPPATWEEMLRALQAIGSLVTAQDEPEAHTGYED